MIRTRRSTVDGQNTLLQERGGGEGSYQQQQGKGEDGRAPSLQLLVPQQQKSAIKLTYCIVALFLRVLDLHVPVVAIVSMHMHVHVCIQTHA